MKKLTYILTSLSIITFFACGGGEHSHEHEADMDHGSEMTEESHADHDHAAMQDAANDNELYPAPEGAKVYFVNLEEGIHVTSPFKVEMGAEGINVHPAGELIEGTGHHHIIVDMTPVPFGEVVPADEHHIHFGGGQTETELELEPGKHTITLQFADGLHRSYGEMMSATIEIEVDPSN